MVRYRPPVVIGLCVAALLCVLLLRPGPASATTPRTKLLNMLNRIRSNHGMHDLRLNLDLSRYAHHHSHRMAKNDRLTHSTHVRSKLRSVRWSEYGENVGLAGNVSRVGKLWMRSAPHRANILTRKFKHVGIGVVRARGWTWVTAIFYG